MQRGSLGALTVRPAQTECGGSESSECRMSMPVTMSLAWQKLRAPIWPRFIRLPPVPAYRTAPLTHSIRAFDVKQKAESPRRALNIRPLSARLAGPNPKVLATSADRPSKSTILAGGADKSLIPTAWAVIAFRQTRGQFRRPPGNGPANSILRLTTDKIGSRCSLFQGSALCTYAMSLPHSSSQPY